MLTVMPSVMTLAKSARVTLYESNEVTLSQPLINDFRPSSSYSANCCLKMARGVHSTNDWKPKNSFGMERVRSMLRRTGGENY